MKIYLLQFHLSFDKGSANSILYGSTNLIIKMIHEKEEVDLYGANLLYEIEFDKIEEAENEIKFNGINIGSILDIIKYKYYILCLMSPILSINYKNRDEIIMHRLHNGWSMDEFRKGVTRKYAKLLRSKIVGK